LRRSHSSSRRAETLKPTETFGGAHCPERTVLSPFRVSDDPCKLGEIPAADRSAAVDRRHRRRTAVGLVAFAVAFAIGAHHVLLVVPSMRTDDDVLEIERAPFYAFGIPKPPERELGPLSDVTLGGTIMLRAHKSPLERIARAPR
jgi:hypothetical protein